MALLLLEFPYRRREKLDIKIDPAFYACRILLRFRVW